MIILPVVLFGLLAKWEEQWVPDERKRKLWARSLIAGSIVVAILIAGLRR